MVFLYRFFMILALILSSACASVYESGVTIQPGLKVYNKEGVPVINPVNASVKQEDYRFNPGDIISVKFPRRPAFSDNCLIRADGKITLPWLGSVEAAGFTPDELQNTISNQYGMLIKSLPPVEERRYPIQVDDLLDIRFPFYPELSSETLVRSDGLISLLMVGEIQAEGKTTSELQTEIKSLYVKQLGRSDVELGVFLKEPRANVFERNGKLEAIPDAGLTEVVISLSKTSPSLIYVGGEVPAPGAQPYQNNIGALQAIYAAGGPALTGDISSVVILRRNPDNSVVRIVSDLTADLDGEGTNDSLLLPFDVVVVPRTTIAKVGDALDQYLYRTIKPLANSSVGMFFTHQVGALHQKNTVAP